MLFKKRTILTVIVVMIVSLFVGCGNNDMDKIYNNDTEIAKGYDSFKLSLGKREIIQSQSYRGKFKLSGCGTVWQYKSEEDGDLKVPYTLSVKGGRAKIVLISPDNKVTTLIENTEKSNVQGRAGMTIPIKKGNNRIKIVGHGHAKINLQLNIKEGEFQKIGFD